MMGDFPSDFTIRDAIKYGAVVHGKTIVINNLDLFLSDWKEMREKCKLCDKLLDVVEHMPISLEEFLEEG